MWAYSQDRLSTSHLGVRQRLLTKPPKVEIEMKISHFYNGCLVCFICLLKISPLSCHSKWKIPEIARGGECREAMKSAAKDISCTNQLE